MKKLFGTDGIRGSAGEFPMDFATVCILGEALMELLRQEGLPPHVIIGRDTRESGKWLEQALFQGIHSKKGQSVSAGVIPTSAISYLTKHFNYSAGIVISASHNPYEDNGIKIFSSAGMKIPEDWEKRLEDTIEKRHREIEPQPIEIVPEPTLGQSYLEFLLQRFPQKNQDRRIKVVLDCSHGASSAIAPFIYQVQGFGVVAINTAPDGRNINVECGSLHPEKLAGSVLEAEADIGIAYDGDADRAIWVDEEGRILNGDHTLFVQTRFMKETDRLHADKVVATTMSNMGLEKALEKLGLSLVRTDVGDRFVLEEMIRCGANLGGEQSGHTIFLDDCPTGDGILTSIRMVEAITSEKAPLSKLVKEYKVFPQVHLNVPVSKKEDFALYPEIVKTKDEIEDRLADRGRFSLRYSGTEYLARIMVEGQEQKELEDLASRMAEVISRHLG
jgi:phosphoglucosamine mutase